jgi:hypothetical protein
VTTICESCQATYTTEGALPAACSVCDPPRPVDDVQAQERLRVTATRGSDRFTAIITIPGTRDEPQRLQAIRDAMDEAIASDDAFPDDSTIAGWDLQSITTEPPEPVG